VAPRFLEHDPHQQIAYYRVRSDRHFRRRLAEQAPVDELFGDPRHPYTRALLSSVLTPEPGMGIPDVGLGESYPDPANIPPGCRFHPRCPLVFDRCRTEAPDNIVSHGRLTECLLAETASGT